MNNAMKKYKRLMFVAVVFLLVSCAANMNSEMDYNEPSIETPTDNETQTDSTESDTSNDQSSQNPSPGSETNTDSSDHSQVDSPNEGDQESRDNDGNEFSDQSNNSDVNQNENTQAPDQEGETQKPEQEEQDKPEEPVTTPSEENKDEKPNIGSTTAKSIASKYGLGHFTLKPNTDYDTGYVSTVESYKGPSFDYQLKGSTDDDGSGTIEAILYCEINHLSPSTGLKFKIVPFVRVEGTVEFVNGKVYDVSSARVWYYLYYDGMINAPETPFAPFELNSADKELINQYLQTR